MKEPGLIVFQNTPPSDTWLPHHAIRLWQLQNRLEWWFWGWVGIVQSRENGSEYPPSLICPSTLDCFHFSPQAFERLDPELPLDLNPLQTQKHFIQALPKWQKSTICVFPETKHHSFPQKIWNFKNWFWSYFRVWVLQHPGTSCMLGLIPFRPCILSRSQQRLPGFQWKLQFNSK